MLRNGTLNRRVRIEKFGGDKDPGGQPIKAWTKVASVWANVKSKTGMGVVSGAQNGVEASVTQYSFRIRYRQGIDTGMRVVMRGIPYDITSVQMDEDAHQWTDLVCNRGANDG